MAFGQESTIVLKDGRTIKGTIVSETEYEYTVRIAALGYDTYGFEKIKILKSDIVTIESEDVNKIEKVYEKENLQGKEKLDKLFGQDTLETALPNEKVLNKKTNWFVDVGFLSNRAPDIFSITRDSKINDNLLWFVTGPIHIIGIGIVKNLKRKTNHETNLSLMVGFRAGIWDVFSFSLFQRRRWVRIAWTKDKIINNKFRYSLGISILLLKVTYDQDIESIFTTAGSFDALDFIPFPILNITYDFGKYNYFQ